MPAPSLSAPYTLELVTYNLNDDADAETFLALNREVGKTEKMDLRHLNFVELRKSDKNGKFCMSCILQKKSDC